jgi:hypothetical protein
VISRRPGCMWCGRRSRWSLGQGCGKGHKGHKGHKTPSRVLYVLCVL